ncbi:unnamed protein product, partial [Adineta steineri]
VVFKDEQEFFDFNRSAIVSKHSFKQCPEMYTRFLESLFESQTYPNENEHDPLVSDVSIRSLVCTIIDFLTDEFI